MPPCHALQGGDSRSTARSLAFRGLVTRAGLPNTAPLPYEQDRADNVEPAT
jgi:hypothetical protein